MCVLKMYPILKLDFVAMIIFTLLSTALWRCTIKIIMRAGVVDGGGGEQ